MSLHMPRCIQSRMQKEHEQPNHPELDRGLARAYATTFIHRYDMYPIQRPDGSYITLKRKLSLDLIASHLQGFVTLGAYALDTDSQARWICLDADTREQWEGVFKLAATLGRQGVPDYLELSRRGGHLWLFLQPMPGAEARRFGKQLLAEHNLEDVELYPKQDELKTGPGSLVRLPLGVHLKTGKRYHFITLAGQPLAPTVREQARLLANPARVSPAFVHEVIARIRQESTKLELHRMPTDARGVQLSDRIKNAVSVYDFVSQYVELDDRGRGHCPFHPDEHKSFSVNRDGNYWHCFAGCGGGSLIDFAMKWRAKHGEYPGFVATLKDLANMLL